MKKPELSGTPLIRRRSSRGFSLIEVVIALAILAVAFFGMISVIAYSTRVNQATKERMFAMRAAEAKIEQMLSCGSFDDIFTEFSKQTMGRGWDEVTETALDGKQYVVLPPVFPAPVTFPAVPTGYVYGGPPNPGANPPTPADPLKPQVTVYVRFPLDAAGNLTEVGSGAFAANMKMDPTTNQPMYVAGVPQYLDLDLNAKNGNTDATLILSEVRVLPVIIEVYWKGPLKTVSGVRGANYLSYRYTFFRKT